MIYIDEVIQRMGFWKKTLEENGWIIESYLPDLECSLLPTRIENCYFAAVRSFEDNTERHLYFQLMEKKDQYQVSKQDFTDEEINAGREEDLEDKILSESELLDLIQNSHSTADSKKEKPGFSVLPTISW